MTEIRAAILVTDDYLYARQFIEELLRTDHDTIKLLIEVDYPLIRWSAPARSLREFCVLALLYGLRGIARALLNFRSRNRPRTSISPGIIRMRTADPNGASVLDALKSHRINLIINQCPCRLGGEILALPSEGVWNRHCGTLPGYRGMYTPFWMWYYRESRATPSIIRVGEKFDDGEILVSESVDISECRFPSQVMAQSMRGSAGQMKRLLVMAANGNTAGQPQTGVPVYRPVPSWTILAKAGKRLVMQSLLR
ncbi:MAG: hypothetical protein AAB229_07065 [Candidatus Hydrogenedentota bacterium]